MTDSDVEDYQKMAIYCKTILQAKESENLDEILEIEDHPRTKSSYNELRRQVDNFEDIDRLEKAIKHEKFWNKLIVRHEFSYGIGTFLFAPIILLVVLRWHFQDRALPKSPNWLVTPSDRAQRMLGLVVVMIGCLGYAFIGFLALFYFLELDFSWVPIILLSGIIIVISLNLIIAEILGQLNWKNFWKMKLLDSMRIAIVKKLPYLFIQAKLLHNEVDENPTLLIAKELAILGAAYGLAQAIFLFFSL